MTRCIVDTNFIIEALGNKVDFAEESKHALPGIQLVVLDQTMRELENLATRDKTITAHIAQLALQYLEKKKISTVQTGDPKHADAVILDLASDKKYSHVATMDLALRKQLQVKGTRIVVLRQRRYLVVV